MEDAMKLLVLKAVNSKDQINIIKLKGSLISKGYTEIIHIDDHDEEFHINSFMVSQKNRSEIHNFIKDFLSKAELDHTVTIVKE